MTKTTIPFDAAAFLHSMRHRSFSFVGAAMLLRAHLTLAPSNRLSRAAVYELFRATTAQTIALVDDVMDYAFREDDQQMIFSPGIDRAMSPLAA
ncbi:MAG: hypothetical protein ABIR54_22355 [Burkholderiaceae bacterium]